MFFGFRDLIESFGDIRKKRPLIPVEEPLPALALSMEAYYELSETKTAPKMWPTPGNPSIYNDRVPLLGRHVYMARDGTDGTEYQDRDHQHRQLWPAAQAFGPSMQGRYMKSNGVTQVIW